MNESKERAKRHALKEEKLRLAFKGNVIARVELLKKILSSYADKKSLIGFELDIERLFAFPENYIGCEHQFNILLKAIDLLTDPSLKDSAKKFKAHLKKLNLPNISW